MDLRRKLLWVDCSAGAVVGVLVVTLHGWLSEWYRLPRDLVFWMGVVNLAYASYSFSLAIRSRRPMRLIQLLVFANLAWAVFFCLRWAIVYSETASFWGLASLVAEAIFVGGLGCLEWRWRKLLLTA